MYECVLKQYSLFDKDVSSDVHDTHDVHDT